MRRFILLSVLCCLVACGKNDETRQALVADPLRAEILARADADLDKVPVTITAFPALESTGGLHDFIEEAD